MGGTLRNSPEFNLITRYFSYHAADRRCDLSIGDDAAVFTVPDGQSLVFSIDTLVEGRHFPSGFAARYVAQRALGAAISDLAAMGAKPSHFTLALTVPEYQDAWISDFSKGLFSVADAYDIALVGGDTTKGPLTVTVQVHGLVPQNGFITRANAASGDGVYVSGPLGDAVAGLQLALAESNGQGVADSVNYLYKRFVSPRPRIDLGMRLRGKATAMLDVSDGLLADLEQLMQASGVCCQINLDSLPISEELLAYRDKEFAVKSALTGGDDYELLATIPEQYAGFAAAEGMTRIGGVHALSSDASSCDAERPRELITLLDCGVPCLLPSTIGFDHFD